MTVRTKYGRRKFDNGNITQGEDRDRGVLRKHNGKETEGKGGCSEVD